MNQDLVGVTDQDIQEAKGREQNVGYAQIA